MFRSILRLTRTRGYFFTQSRNLLKEPKRKHTVGVSAIKFERAVQDECLYPAINGLNVETRDRCHSFSVPISNVVKFIQFGAINTQMAVQYCHYIAHLTRSTEMPEDRDYYASICSDLLSHVLRHEKELPPMVVAKLLADVADTTRENTEKVIEIILMRTAGSLPFRNNSVAQIFGSLCKLGLWNVACQFLHWISGDTITPRLGEKFVIGTIEASKEYTTVGADSPRGKQIRIGILDTLKELCRMFRLKRVQFITDQKQDFIQALTNLGFEVNVNLMIKMSGRCVKCQTLIPLYDIKTTARINAAVKKQLLLGSEKGLYLNTSPIDVGKFTNFLKHMHDIDRKPIDCVVDGLNVAYRNAREFNYITKKFQDDVTSTHKVMRPETQAHVLINSIIRNDMLKTYKKILVIGRQHMTYWPNLMEFFKKNNIYFYASHNNSKDDLFQLYAATLSPKTVLVTNDFLRDHIAKLDGNDRTELERWIDTHQVWIESRDLGAIWPTPYEKIAHYDESNKRFHLPVIDSNLLDLVGVSQPPPHLNSKMTTWLCLKAEP